MVSHSPPTCFCEAGTLKSRGEADINPASARLEVVCVRIPVCGWLEIVTASYQHCDLGLATFLILSFLIWKIEIMLIMQ